MRKKLLKDITRRIFTLVIQSKTPAELETNTKACYASFTETEIQVLKKYAGWPIESGTLSLKWQLKNPSFKEELQSDIRPVLRKVSCPVLALCGEKDCQVPPKENLEGIERELKAGGNKDFTIRELPGLNHMFQTCKSGSMGEYSRIEETMASLVLQTVSDWLLAQAAKQKPLPPKHTANK